MQIWMMKLNLYINIYIRKIFQYYNNHTIDDKSRELETMSMG